MAKSYFAILGVSSNASSKDIHSAYRRLAKEFHPDYYGDDSKPFIRVQEAYSVLGDPLRRKAYESSLIEGKTATRTVPPYYSQPEPLIPENQPVDFGEISPVRSFQRYAPSVDEVFDWLWENFTTLDHPKSGRIENLTLEVLLTREQARQGGNAKVMVPASSVCPVCKGLGNVGFYACQRCAGEGVINGEVPVTISFPPGITSDHSVMIPLERFGIRNLYMMVLFRPRDADTIF